MKNLLRLLSLLALSSTALAGNYVGDYNVGDTVDCNFGTVNPSTGASFTLAGTPVISAYIDNSTTELTAGITLTADFDTRTGLNHVRVAATGGNGYAAGTFVSLVITTGTVNSISVVGQEVCSFTLRKGTITGIPAATAGAAGGIQIAGSNAATTFATLTVTGATTLSDGLVVARSTSNSPAATFTGNGTGNGITITSGAGATGTGLAIASGATNGAGATITGTGTGNGATFTSGSGATGNGLSAVAASTNGNGINTAGTGTGSGELDTGGATGHGIRAVGGATSGSGVSAVASTSGSGIVATGVGTTQPGIAATGGSTSSAGISATGGGTGNGILATSGAGATGNGIQATAASTNGSAIGVTPTGTGLVFSTPANANVTQYGGSAGTFASGRPEVNTTLLAGTSLATLTGAYPSLGIVDSGTAQAATGTTLQIRSAATFADNELTGASCIITGGTTGVGQSRTVSSNVGSTDTLTVPTWTTTPTGTITYVCYGTAAGSGSAAPTVAQIATGVWQDATSGDFTVASSIGKSLYTSGVAPGSSGGLPTVDANNAVKLQSGTGANQISLSSGAVLLQATQTGVTIPTVTNLTNAPTAGDFTATMKTSIGTAVAASAVASVTGNVGGIASGGIADASFATTAGPFRALGIVDQGTAQAATGTTLQLRSAATFANSELVGARILITGGTTGVGQSRLITGYVGATDTATVATWDTTPTGTITYTVSSSTAAAAGGGLDAAATRAALGFASANFDSQIATLATSSALSTVSGKIDVVDDYVDTEVAAIKAKTDQLTFSVAGQVDANAESMNAEAICGTGDSGTPWKGCP